MTTDTLKKNAFQEAVCLLIDATLNHPIANPDDLNGLKREMSHFEWLQTLRTITVAGPRRVGHTHAIEAILNHLGKDKRCLILDSYPDERLVGRCQYAFPKANFPPLRFAEQAMRGQEFFAVVVLGDEVSEAIVDSARRATTDLVIRMQHAK